MMKYTNQHLKNWKEVNDMLKDTSAGQILTADWTQAHSLPFLPDSVKPLILHEEAGSAYWSCPYQFKILGIKWVTGPAAN